MVDDHINKKRKSKWNTSYSDMSIKQAEDRLGFRLCSLKEIPIKAMLEHAEPVSLDEAKEEVYKEIKRYYGLQVFR